MGNLAWPTCRSPRRCSDLHLHIYLRVGQLRWHVLSVYMHKSRQSGSKSVNSIKVRYQRRGHPDADSKLPNVANEDFSRRSWDGNGVRVDGSCFSHRGSHAKALARNKGCGALRA